MLKTIKSHFCEFRFFLESGLMLCVIVMFVLGHLLTYFSPEKAELSAENEISSFLGNVNVSVPNLVPANSFQGAPNASLFRGLTLITTPFATKGTCISSNGGFSPSIGLQHEINGSSALIRNEHLYNSEFLTINLENLRNRSLIVNNENLLINVCFLV